VNEDEDRFDDWNEEEPKLLATGSCMIPGEGAVAVERSGASSGCFKLELKPEEAGMLL